jgi:hypothetical protein
MGSEIGLYNVEGKLLISTEDGLHRVDPNEMERFLAEDWCSVIASAREEHRQNILKQIDALQAKLAELSKVVTP